MKKKTVLSTFISVMIAGSSFAFDMNDAVTLGLQNNANLLSQEADNDAQFYQRNTAVAAFLPTVSVGASHQIDPKRVNPKTGKRTEAQPYGAQLTVSYNLFNGLHDLFGLLAGQDAYEASQLQYNGHVEDLKLNIRTAYLGYLSAIDNLTISRDFLDKTQKDYDDTSQKVRLGSSSQIDQLKVAVDLADAKLNVDEAIAAIDRQRRNLHLLIGADVAPENLTEQTSKIDTAYQIATYDTLESRMLENRDEIRALKLVSSANQYKLGVDASGYLPKVDLTLKQTAVGNSSIPTTNYGSGKGNGAKTLELSLSWNLFAGFATTNTVMSDYKKFYSSVNSAAYTTEQLKTKLFGEYTNFNLQKQRITRTEQQLEQAETNYNNIHNKYVSGLASSQDLLDAKNTLLKVKTSVSLAKYNFLTSIYTLRRLVQAKITP